MTPRMGMGTVKIIYPRPYPTALSSPHPVARTASATNVKQLDSWGGRYRSPWYRVESACGCSDPLMRKTQRPGCESFLFYIQDVAVSRARLSCQHEPSGSRRMLTLAST